MSVIIILLVASITVAALFLVAFLWNVKTGQYDDEISPAIRMLFDDIYVCPKGDCAEQTKKIAAIKKQIGNKKTKNNNDSVNKD
ncbi:cbb3-type cytochrome oxidase assembly protein CcoS [Parasediminibacterium sp. JCM 36343]|uniref:cbb3-type cytochrome oxidase assembly protein CcoS n=1 Tax=Parasediminibacterium sp. JCM 36343 TaxID=3374279 RepID=UPI00397AEF74